MKLAARKIPDEFIRSIPRGLRIVRKNDQDFLLVEALFCPNGHNLVVDSVRIHDEASIGLKVAINEEPGSLFVDAFWGSHTKLFSFIPKISTVEPVFVSACCPYCDVEMMEDYQCPQKGCGSSRGVRLALPGGTNKIHVCAKLGCPGHELEVREIPSKVVRSVNVINYFGSFDKDPFGGY